MQNQLQERIISGDQAAFREIVDQYQAMVRSICRRFVLAPEDADDISQTAFLEVFLKMKSFKGACSFSTWIYRITVSKCIDFTRARKRRERITVVKSFFSGRDSEAGGLPEPGGSFDDPQYDFARREDVRILYKALEKLPESQRAALLLSKVDGFSYQEIAETLNTSVPAVESLIFRGKANLRKAARKLINEN